MTGEPPPVGAPVVAMLGPTNTGKTHRAVERMLEHDSGMIGLPLRLLAREVYDRVTARVGEQRVGLVTGEEKRVPANPAYWVCTVEAMPVDREVDFLAVDEVQLAAHDQRGHVFTDRLLHARGLRETWFMGAETIRSIVTELVPAARHVTHPRLSRLSARGMEKLSRLPPRSAVVAFSLPEVYELAERLRALRGGAAVVLGALSPRTRNAQVAMFQSGEVDYVVATDAIGMGLNLDVAHVAFASLRKFDGKSPRDLEAAELAQIAGRAGRYLADGTFGTLAPYALPSEVAVAIEAHAFPQVRRVLYRSTDLDCDSVEGLVASLDQRPSRGCLRFVGERDDTMALRMLAADPAVRAKVKGPERVALLWELCQVPDYRKTWFESHVAWLAELFGMITGPRGEVNAAWMEQQVAEIDDPRGGIDALTARLASIRCYTFLANRGRYLDRARHFQERTREVEDRLSDALHERLIERFVDRSAPHRRPAPRRPRRQALPSEAMSPPDDGHPFAALAALRTALAPLRKEVTTAVGASGWVEALVAAGHERFAVDASGAVTYEGEPMGWLAPGTTLLLPDVRLGDLPEVGQGARSRISRRLLAFARDWVSELLTPLHPGGMEAVSPGVRGLVYQLDQGLGTARSEDVAEQLAHLDAADLAQLERLGVEVGARVVHVRALLGAEAFASRVTLVRVFFQLPSWAAPRPGMTSLPAARGTPPRAYLAVGYPVFGPRAVRADIVERAARALMVEGEDRSDARLSSLLGCPMRELRGVVEALAP